jgi:hypothetical protein
MIGLAAAPEATEAAAAPRRITRTPIHGYAATREAPNHHQLTNVGACR